MNETIDYLGERYPDLSDEDLGELREVGYRFCKPAIKHGGENTAKREEDANAA
jgi:hypothetical protein